MEQGKMRTKKNRRAGRAWDVHFDPTAKQYIKEYQFFSKDWYDEHPKLMNKYYPNYFVSKYCTENSMTMVYNEVAGNTLGVLKDVHELDKLYKFCVSECKRTYPYAHMDWARGNIICKPNGDYHLIDFDDFCKSDWFRTLKMLHNHFKKFICPRDIITINGSANFWKRYWKWKKGKQWKEFMNVEIMEKY